MRLFKSSRTFYIQTNLSSSCLFMKKVIPVVSKKELGAFIDFPHELYKDDPYYVPELFIAQRDLLTKHPFHKHNKLQGFLVYDDNKLVGRIAAILNNAYNEYNKANDGFFGFLFLKFQTCAFFIANFSQLIL